MTGASLAEAPAPLAQHPGGVVVLDSEAESEQLLRWLQMIHQTRPQAILLLSPQRPAAPELDWLATGIIRGTQQALRPARGAEVGAAVGRLR